MLPPWPEWDSLHPFVVHFPIALLLVAPVCVLLAMLAGRRSAGFRAAALLMLLAGTLSLLAAISTGKAAGELADHSPAINAVMSRHVEMAGSVRNVFAGLTLLYAALLLAHRWIKALARPVGAFASHAVYLVLLLAACVLLLNTSHEGGKLVHQLGVHAMLPPDAPGK
jgi:uncharacterized membrane protein